MITSQQRARLRALANKEEAILQIGKEGLLENALKQLDDALEARELVKCSVLRSCEKSARELCRESALALGAEEVQVIGRRFTLFRPSKKHPALFV